MEKVHLGLGGNSGDTEKAFQEVILGLSAIFAGLRVSAIYRSSARYYEDQADFLNAVVEGWTGLSPRELLVAANALEAAAGRDRSKEIRKGPRRLDIDILLFGRHLIAESDLIIPHPGLRERKFALLPLVELDPNLTDPVSGSPLSAFLSSLPPQGIYLLHPADYDLLYL